MRKKIGNAFRKAGGKLNEWDAAYANKLYTEGDGIVNQLGNLGRAVPLSESSPQWEFDQNVSDASRKRGEFQKKAVTAGTFTANLASRYLLPAGGVTLAGKGLYDLIGQFGSVADQPQPTEIRLQ